MDPVIANAVAAENTPANGSPDERAAILQQNQQQRQQQVDNRSYPEKYAAEKAAQKAAADQAAEAKLSPAEKKIATIRSTPAFFDVKHADHEKVMVEYRAAMFSGMTEAERNKLIESSPSEIRSTFGVIDPREHMRPDHATAAPATITTLTPSCSWPARERRLPS